VARVERNDAIVTVPLVEVMPIGTRAGTRWLVLVDGTHPAVFETENEARVRGQSRDPAVSAAGRTPRVVAAHVGGGPIASCTWSRDRYSERWLIASALFVLIVHTR
jgi:hypothetical protein